MRCTKCCWALVTCVARSTLKLRKLPYRIDLFDDEIETLRTFDPENQRSINKARKAIPTSHEIWLAAARLQEQDPQEGKATANVVMKMAVKALAKVEAMPSREDWIKEAEKCEEEGAPETCHAIISETLGWQLEEDDGRKKIWMDDAVSSIAHGRYETARAIYAYALRVFYTKKSIWRAAAELEKNHGTKEALWSLLEKVFLQRPSISAMGINLWPWRRVPTRAAGMEYSSYFSCSFLVLPTGRAYLCPEWLRVLPAVKVL